MDFVIDGGNLSPFFFSHGIFMPGFSVGLSAEHRIFVKMVSHFTASVPFLMSLEDERNNFMNPVLGDAATRLLSPFYEFMMEGMSKWSLDLRRRLRFLLMHGYDTDEAIVGHMFRLEEGFLFHVVSEPGVVLQEPFGIVEAEDRMQGDALEVQN